MYTTKDICEKYGVSRETVRLWTNDFAGYLSPTATPEKGRQRNYTDDDLSVFALISEMKSTGAQHDEIALALAAGQRGNPPNESQMVARPDANLTAIRREVAQLRQELDITKNELLMIRGENRLLKEQVDQRERQIRDLYREMARLEAAQDNEGE